MESEDVNHFILDGKIAIMNDVMSTAYEEMLEARTPIYRIEFLAKKKYSEALIEDLKSSTSGRQFISIDETDDIIENCIGDLKAKKALTPKSILNEGCVLIHYSKVVYPYDLTLRRFILDILDEYGENFIGPLSKKFDKVWFCDNIYVMVWKNHPWFEMCKKYQNR